MVLDSISWALILSVSLLSQCYVSSAIVSDLHMRYKRINNFSPLPFYTRSHPLTQASNRMLPSIIRSSILGSTPCNVYSKLIHCKKKRVALTQLGLSQLQVHYQTMCIQTDRDFTSTCRSHRDFTSIAVLQTFL